MRLLEQEMPVFDVEDSSKGTRAEKIVPTARRWAEVGSGAPVALHALQRRCHVEPGRVLVADMVTRQAWDDTVPIHVERGGASPEPERG